MKQVFKKFELGDRTVTLAAVNNIGSEMILIGYAVRMPGDKEDEEMAQRIALGRANSKKHLKQYPFQWGSQPLLKEKAIYEAILGIWQRNLTREPSRYIKGLIKKG